MTDLDLAVPFESHLHQLCVDALLRFSEEMPRIRRDPFAWKWAVVALHNCVLCAATKVQNRREPFGSVKRRAGKNPGREDLVATAPKLSPNPDRKAALGEYARGIAQLGQVMKGVRVLGLLQLYDLAVEGTALAPSDPTRRLTDPTRVHIAHLDQMRDALFHPHPLKTRVRRAEALAVSATALRVVRVLVAGWDIFEQTDPARGHTIVQALDLADKRLKAT